MSAKGNKRNSHRAFRNDPGRGKGGNLIQRSESRDETEAFFDAVRANKRIRQEKMEIKEQQRKKAITLPSMESLRRLLND